MSTREAWGCVFDNGTPVARAQLMLASSLTWLKILEGKQKATDWRKSGFSTCSQQALYVSIWSLKYVGRFLLRSGVIFELKIWHFQWKVLNWVTVASLDTCDQIIKLSCTLIYRCRMPGTKGSGWLRTSDFKIRKHLLIWPMGHNYGLVCKGPD